MPVTGGQFRVENIDPQRDEILLARNDRYWAAPALPDHILMRRAGAPAALADSMRNGDTQVAQVHGGAAAFAQLSAIPDVRTARIMTPRTMQMSLRAAQPKLADVRVRKAILGLLDVDLLGGRRRRQRQHGHARAGAGAVAVGSGLCAHGAARDDARTPRSALLTQAGYEIDTDATTPPTPAPPSAGSRTTEPPSPTARVDPRADQQGRCSAVPGDRGGRQRPDVRRRRQHRCRPAAQCRDRRVGPAAGPGGALRRRGAEQPRGRGRRLARAGGDLATELASRYGCRAGDPPAPNGTTPTAPSSTTPFTSSTPTTGQPDLRTGPGAGRTSAGTQATSPVCAIRRFSRASTPRCRVTFRSARRSTAVEPKLWDDVDRAADPAGHHDRRGRPARGERQPHRRGARRHRRRCRPLGEDAAMKPTE